MARFKPGQSGNPAGRPKGSPNRRELLDMLAERFGEDYDPVVKLAEIAEDPDTARELRVRCLAEIAPYVRPRRKAVELGGGGGTLEELVANSLADKMKAARERVAAGRAELAAIPPAAASCPASEPLLPPVSQGIARAHTREVEPDEPEPARPIPITLPDSEPDGYASGQVFNPL